MSDENVDTEVDETEEVDNARETDCEQEEWTPPSRESVTKLEATAKARKAERDAARRELAELKAEREKPEDKPDEAAKWRETAARSSAAVAIQAAGFSGSAKEARRLTALLSLADAEPDDAGDFDFEDEIEDLKESFPALFETRRVSLPRKPVTSDRGGSDGGPKKDRTSELMLRRAGYVR